MKKISKDLLQIMKKESTEERTSIDDLILQMEYRLNKRIALFENRIRMQILILSHNMFTPESETLKFIMASKSAIIERIQIQSMPASPLFKSGGYHHKFEVDEDSGEVVMKHPKKNGFVFPEPFQFILK